MERIIKSRKQLHDCIDADRKANLGDKPISFEMRFRKNNHYLIFRYLEQVRKLEYIGYLRDVSKGKVSYFFYAQCIKIVDRRRNHLGRCVGIEIPENHVMPGVRITHPNVILNGYVDKGCTFHGNNVLGNKRAGDNDAIPKLGKHVDVGTGAIIIGDVIIADDCIIGAGAVVMESFLEKGTVIAGVPAKNMKEKNDA